jgi:glutaconate CoA-transferase subunit A
MQALAATPPILSVDALVAQIQDGATVALPPDYSGCAMTAIGALIRRGVRDLHLVGVPALGFQADWLIGAGAVARVETAAVTLGEFGLAPRFNAALRSGEIEIWDATCPAIHAALQAAEKGVPFMPLRGIIGSDLLEVRPDWKVIQNPLAESGVDDPIVILPAIRPDVTLFHAAKADRDGNVWIGVRRELMLMAHASRRAFVTVERIDDANFLADPALAAGTIPALYVSALAIAPRGAAPIGLVGVYGSDTAALRRYVAAAKTPEGFAAWRVETIDAVEPLPIR